ncbi:MAG TPA: DNA polymerase III subunit beta [Candidatus Paceibacterota bacterium]|jgi:DNA polymerase-3 subunit beta|nr:DNA polymerase III subunit beta [Candidatus Paceibacterota bacterium]
MKIECGVEKLKNAVLLTDRMTGKNLTLPILHALLITATGKTLKIKATNLNVGIEVEIPATVSSEGSLLVKGDVIANVCNHLDGAETATLELIHDNLSIKTKKNSTIIKCLPQEEFPTLPIVEGESFSIKATDLSEGIRSVYFCAATTDIKPEIASIFIHSEGGVTSFVATDSFRLAEKKIKIKEVPEINKILIPYKNITDLLRTVDAFPDTIRVAFNKNQLSLSGNGIYFTTRLIDGAFPEYQLIIPKEEKTKVVVMKQEILNTLRLSTVFSDKFLQVLFTADPTKKQITIQSKNTDIGSSDSSIDAVIEGESIEVSFNLKYFLDVFQSINGDSIAISFTTPNKPIVVRSVQDNSFLYLLVPTNR